MKKTKDGITLIALIISIIVMLILVGVTVTVAINGGLFGKAREGAKETEIARQKEELTIAVASAYDVSTGIIKQDELEKKLGEGWNVEGVEGEEGAPYNCTIGENEYIVCENGKILVVDYNKILQLMELCLIYEEGEEDPSKQLFDELQLDNADENAIGVFMVEKTTTTQLVYCYFYESGIMFKMIYTCDEVGEPLGFTINLADKTQDEYAYKLARKLRKVKVELDDFFLGKTKDEITAKYTEEELENYLSSKPNNPKNINSIDIEYDDSSISIRSLEFSINGETIDFCDYNNNVELIKNEEGIYYGTQFFCFS